MMHQKATPNTSVRTQDTTMRQGSGPIPTMSIAGTTPEMTTRKSINVMPDSLLRFGFADESRMCFVSFRYSGRERRLTTPSSATAEHGAAAAWQGKDGGRKQPP